MRRKDREMNEEFALSIVDSCEYANIAMVRPDGVPYCLPISIVRMGGYIYFHGAKEGEKADTLRNDPNVCISCVGYTSRPDNEFTTEFESAIVFGRAEELESDDEKIEALHALCLRHNPANMPNFNKALAESLPVTAMWKVSIDKITGKRKRYDKNGVEMKYGRME